MTSFERLIFNKQPRFHKKISALDQNGNHDLNNFKNLQASALINDQDRVEISRITPSTAAANTILSVQGGEQQFDFRGPYNYILSQTLKFTLNNISATAQTVKVTTHVSANNGVAVNSASGSFVIYANGKVSIPLAFNTAAATIQSTIRALDTTLASITVTGLFSTCQSVAPVVITYTGCTSDYTSLMFISQLSDATHTLSILDVLTTPFAYGDTVKLIPAQNLIDNIKLIYGGVAISEITGTQIWLDNLTLNTDDGVNLLSSVSGFDRSTYLSDLILLPSTSRTVYVKFDNPLNNHQLPIKNLPGGTRIGIDVKFRSGSTLLETLTGSGGLITDVTLTNLELIIQTVKHDNIVDELERKQLQKERFDFRIISPSFSTIESTAYTASVATRKKLSTTIGELASLYLFPRLTNAVTPGVDLYYPRALNEFEIQDNNGSSISGGFQIPSDYYRHVAVLRSYNSKVFRTLPIYHWTPSKNFLHATTSGGLLGSHLMTSNEFLYFSTANSETITIDVYSNIYKHLSIFPDGKVIVQQ